jgi:hypothetical protein
MLPINSSDELKGNRNAASESFVAMDKNFDTTLSLSLEEEEQPNEAPRHDAAVQKSQVIVTIETPVVEQPQVIPVASKPKKKDPTTLLVIGGTILLALFIIAINFFMFQPPVRTVASPLAPLPEISQQVSKSLSSNSKTIQLAGQFTDEQQRTTSVEGFFDDASQQYTLKILITTPPPAPLSLEAIGRHETLPLWIKKIEFDKKTVALQDALPLQFNVPVRIYYEHNDEKTRVMSTAAITLTKVQDTLTAHVAVAPVDKVLDTPLTVSVTATFSS